MIGLLYDSLGFVICKLDLSSIYALIPRRRDYLETLQITTQMYLK